MQVTNYDADTGEWVVEWLEGTTKERGTQLRLPRLRVYLKAEDPFNFADRVADAHASKEVGSVLLHYEQNMARPLEVIFWHMSPAVCCAVCRVQLWLLGSVFVR